MIRSKPVHPGEFQRRSTAESIARFARPIRDFDRMGAGNAMQGGCFALAAVVRPHGLFDGGSCG